MADKLMVAKTGKHLAAETDKAKIAERAGKIKALAGKDSKSVTLADIYEQNELIIEIQNEIWELLLRGQ